MSVSAYFKEEGTAAVSVELISEVEQRLYREVRFLDDEEYRKWTDMMTPDVHYFMPGIETRYRKDKTDQMNDLSRMAYYNDNLEELGKRIDRLETGTAWSEDPATRFCHIISNIEVETTNNPDEVLVYSNFLVYRNRLERDEDTLIGSRKDLWRREDGVLKLAKRRILLKQNVLISKNMNVYF
jgi:ethylbenzene dioxygenase beta subunit